MYGDIIRKYRRLRGFTQQQLADLVGVSEKTVSSWETDRTETNMEAITNLSKALSVPKSVLVGEEYSVEKLSKNEVELLLAYRSASSEIRAAVEAILKVR